MQQMNDSGAYEFGNDENFDRFSHASRRSWSANKTGGHIQLANVKPEDLTPAN